MIVRPEHDADHETIRDVVTLAFDDARVAGLVEAIRASEYYVPDLARVAVDGGVIVGHIMVSYATLEGPEPVGVLLLSPLAVTPTRQRQGIGAALVSSALDRADRRAEPLVVVEGVPGYYPRFGFERARAHGLEPPSAHIPDAAFMVRPLTAYRGDLRGRVVYPPAFDTLTG